MSISEINFEKIKPLNALAFMNLITSLFSGFMFLFLFKPNLFWQLDYLRLIIISISIPAPMVILNSTLLFFIFRNQAENLTSEVINEKIIGGLLMGSIFSIIILFTSFLLEFLFDWGVKSGVIIISILELILTFTLYNAAFNLKNNKTS